MIGVNANFDFDTFWSHARSTTKVCGFMWSREGEGEEKLSHWESFPIVLFTGRPLPKDSERRSDIIFIHVSSTTKTSLEYTVCSVRLQ